MANEITVTAALTFVKGAINASFAKVLQNFTVTGRDYVHRTQAIGSSEEAVNLGELSTLGWGIFFHTGTKPDGTTTTQTISLRPASGVADMIELQPGEFFMGPLKPAGAPYAIASGSDQPVMEFLLVED